MTKLWFNQKEGRFISLVKIFKEYKQAKHRSSNQPSFKKISLFISYTEILTRFAVFMH